MSLIEAPVTTPITTDDGDHEKFAHVVAPASEVTRAMVEGTPCTALCGKSWVPTRAPEKFPICPDCKEILEFVQRAKNL